MNQDYTYQLILLRHGQSQWNLENKFTGWTDVDLSENGDDEAREAARLIKEAGLRIDVAHTSRLKRAIRTLWIVLDELDDMWVPVHRAWRLNEKHYGALQGLNKKETAQKEGEEQVFAWRRDYDTRPPALEEEDERHPRNDRHYQDLPSEVLPATECLKDVVTRVLPYWQDELIEDMQEGKTILVAAHGNSLRALVKHLDNVPEEEISSLNIPTGIPLVYELDADFKAIRHYYLGDEKAAKKAAEKVANQAK